MWILTDEGEQLEITEKEFKELGLSLKLTPPVGALNLYRSSAFRRLPLDVGPQILGDGILPRACKLVVYGKEKTRKSFLSMQLCKCVGRGETFLGIDTTQGRSVYIQSELSAAAVQQRMKADWGDGFVANAYSLKLDERQGAKDFLDSVAEVNPDLVVIDPLYKVLTGDLNDASAVQVVLDVLDEAIEETGTSVVLVHHENREGKVQGSGRILQWPDGVLHMRKKTPESPKHRLVFEAMRHCVKTPKDIHLVFNDETCEFDVSDEKTLKERVFEWLDSGGEPEELEREFPEENGITLRGYRKNWRDSQ